MIVRRPDPTQPIAGIILAVLNAIERWKLLKAGDDAASMTMQGNTTNPERIGELATNLIAQVFGERPACGVQVRLEGAHVQTSILSDVMSMLAAGHEPDWDVLRRFALDAGVLEYSAAPPEHPIVFLSRNVLSIMDGTKTETRRVAVPDRRCPYGRAGHRLWVKESWALEEIPVDGQRLIWKVDRAAIWRADPSQVFYMQTDYEPRNRLWHSPLFMSRWMSRLLLTVTSIRVERLSEIDEAGARAEGIAFDDSGTVVSRIDGHRYPSHVAAYRVAWEHIHGRKSWMRDPLVYVVGFKICKMYDSCCIRD